MIAPPLNDQECLAKLTEVAAEGVRRPDLRGLASRFPTTAALAAWFRSLPQRDDQGDPADGPRVECDVTQRARLVAADPNCVERAIGFLAAAEIIDPRPVRQLATVDTPRGRHTFPIENGEPVVLDPALTRNGLRAGVWMIRNAGQEPSPAEVAAAMEPYSLFSWLADLAEDVAEERDGQPGVDRVARSRRVFAAILDGRPVSARGRADAEFTLRMAEEATPAFGVAGRLGLRLARATVARLAAPRPGPPRNLRVNPERAVYWTGKAIATYYGVGGLYDPAYQQVVRRRRTGGGPRSPPRRQGLGRVSARRVPGSLHALEKERKG